MFDKRGSLLGAGIETYLLEKVCMADGGGREGRGEDVEEAGFYFRCGRMTYQSVLGATFEIYVIFRVFLVMSWGGGDSAVYH